MYTARNQEHKAENMYHYALKMHKVMGNDKGRATCYNMLGQLYSKQKQLAELSFCDCIGIWY